MKTQTEIIEYEKVNFRVIFEIEKAEPETGTLGGVYIYRAYIDSQDVTQLIETHDYIYNQLCEIFKEKYL